MPVRHITGSESSSSPIPDESILRTPSVTDSTGGAISEDQARKRNRMVKTADQVAQLAFENGLKVSSSIAASLLPTPVVNDMGAGKTVERWDDWTAETKAKHQNGNGHGPSLNIEMLRLLPTPNTMEHRETKTPLQEDIDKTNEWAYRMGVSRPKQNDLLGTPRTSSAHAATQKQIDAGAPKARIEDQVLTTNWGKFEPAIRRWEEVIGRPAPAPTKPDGKDGAHRLSSAFTEWMMGVPEGWITDCGLTRNEELKACGNGVVPQQAELALRYLLEGIGWQERERRGNVSYAYGE